MGIAPAANLTQWRSASSSLSMSETSQLPTAYGKYQLLERIAQGGMADVFLARTFGVEGFEKRLVIKRILPGLEKSPHFVRMFINEARISVCLDHPNIVQVYELGRVESDYFIAMEHIYGRDLTRVVRALRAQGRRLPIPLAVYVVASAVRGLAYAHALTDAHGKPLGLVHGDVSPHNLVISFAGEVKLVDFGIARIAGTGWGDKAGRPGGGKFAYMSPEQVNGETIDARSDVFSAGIVLYELLVDHRLYQHADPEVKLQLVRDAVVPDPRSENPEIPDALWEILKKALARKPAGRHASAQSLEDDLRSFLFHNHLRGDTTAMSDFMADLFADSVGQNPASAPAERLAAELRGDQPAPPPDSHSAGYPPEATLPQDVSSFLSAEANEELRTVTVLAVEPSGNTDVSRSVHPDRMVDRQRDLVTWVRRHVHRFGGLLTAGTDETFLVLFGTNRTRIDDPERAITCAMELLASARDPRSLGQPIDLCIGIHQGEAAISHVADHGPPHVVGRGDTLKLARRLASVAGLGEIRVSDRVASQAREMFDFEKAPPLSHRGREAEIRVWTMMDRRPNLPLADGAWLQRGREMEELHEALLALSTGQGRLLVLTGPAGSGKSHLIREILHQVRSRRIPAWVARARPFGVDGPYPVLQELVASIAGVEAGTPPAGLRKRLEELRKYHLADADIGVFASLLLPGSGRRVALSREMVLEAGRRLVIGLAESGPTLVVIEDIQLLDPLERELVARLAGTVQDRSVLVLLSTSERPPDEIARMSPAVIRLAGLSRDAQARLMREKLGVDEVDAGLADAVAADAAGNPLFTLEYLRALQDAGLIRREGGRLLLQDSVDLRLTTHMLRGLLAARLDDLEPQARSLLQLAAAIGMRARAAVLFEAWGRTDGAELVETLVHDGLLTPEGEPGNETLVFTGPGVWDVAARCTLGSQLRAQHRQIARAMLKVHADELEPHLESIAYHAAAGGALLEAIYRIGQAAASYRKTGSFEKAMACLERGLDWLDESALRSRNGQATSSEPETITNPSSGLLPGTVSRVELSISFHRQAGEVSYLLGLLRKAEHHLQLALDEAADAGFPTEEAACCVVLGRVCSTAGRVTEAQAYLDQALSAASANGMVEIMLTCVEARAELAAAAGQGVEAERLFRQVVDAAASFPMLLAHTRIGLAGTLIRRDALDEALFQLEKASIEGRAICDPLIPVRSVHAIGLIHSLRGEYTEALDCFRRASEARPASGFRQGQVTNLHNIGECSLQMGDIAAASQAFEQSAELARSMSWPQALAMNEVFQGYLEAVRGDENGIALLERAIASGRRSSDRDLVATGLWLRARFLRGRGENEEASTALDEAILTARSAGAVALARVLSQDR
jgi:eukaryotic-like serine/threonine-protein kinase